MLHTDTQKLQSCYLCKHTHSVLHIWTWHTLWKWLLPSADLSSSTDRRVGLSAWQGQDLGAYCTHRHRDNHTHTQWDFTLTFDMLRNQRWSYTYFKLKLFQWMSFWGIIRALFVKTDLFKDANPLKKPPKATSWRYTFCTDLKQFILLTPSPILVNKRLNLFAQSFEFLFSVSHNS